VDAVKNELFLALRDASHHFQDALSQLFSSTARKELLRYAIF
jgi:hypothetical protein